MTQPRISPRASAIAPLAPAFVLTLAIAIASWPDWPPLSTIKLFVYAAAFSYAFFAVLGVPTILYLQRREHSTLPWLAFGGAMCGLFGASAILALLVLMFGVGGLSLRSAAETIGYGCFAGTLISVTYWAVQKTA